MPRSHEDIEQRATAAIDALIRKDEFDMSSAVDPLLLESDPSDLYRFLLVTIDRATAGTPRREDLPPEIRETARYGVMAQRRDPKTGKVVLIPPDELPRPVVIYARIAAAWVSNNPDVAKAAWADLWDHGDPEQAGIDIGRVLYLGVSQAARAEAARRAALS